MSYRKEKVLSLTGREILEKSVEDSKDLFKDILHDGIHGLCISPYGEGQKPGDELSLEQVTKRIEVIQPHISWLRSFSCTVGNELIPKVAKEKGLKTLVGAWLGKDEYKNRQEIDNLIELAQNGHADIIAVGNEVLYRGDLTELELLNYIKEVKSKVNNIPVGYVDAYYEFEFRQEITDECDVILANCYPFWEGCSFEYSLLYMKDMYKRALRAGKGKKVIITETGWPTEGNSFHGAKPSYENALKYFINTQNWSKEENIDIFYFSSFDESWKIDTEGDVGAFWGLWDKNEKLKF